MNNQNSISLNKQERQVLRVLEFAGEVPYSTLSEQIGMTAKKFGTTVQQLEHRGILSSLVPIINPWNIGHQYFGIRFTAAFQLTMTEVVQSFIQTPGVVWFETTSGEHDYNTTLCTPSVQRVATFMAELGNIYENFFASRSLYYPYEVTLYGKRFLYPEISIPSIKIRDTQSPMEHSSQDLQLLRTIATNVPSMRDVARMIDLSASAISRRLLHYEEQQTILAYERHIRLQQCGYTTRVGAISFSSLNTSVSQQLEQFAKEHLHVCFMIKALGDIDLFLGMDFDSQASFLSFKESFLKQFSEHITSASWYEHISIEKASYF